MCLNKEGRNIIFECKHSTTDMQRKLSDKLILEIKNENKLHYDIFVALTS